MKAFPSLIRNVLIPWIYLHISFKSSWPLSSLEVFLSYFFYIISLFAYAICLLHILLCSTFALLPNSLCGPKLLRYSIVWPFYIWISLFNFFFFLYFFSFFLFSSSNFSEKTSQGLHCFCDSMKSAGISWKTFLVCLAIFFRYHLIVLSISCEIIEYSFGLFLTQVGTKVAAVSRKTNTTTHEVLGVMTKGNTQIVWPLNFNSCLHS